ncbi:MAG TPA: hypothetical protein VM008_10915 [Phycisphaerae bacterium]|nr:hypothetical protein [Phycisphaerae bacterium]
MKKLKRISRFNHLVTLSACHLVIAFAGAGGFAQTLPAERPLGDGPSDVGPGDPVVRHGNDPIHIVQPTVDKEHHRVSLPAAFWNQHMTNWVEVAVCGRPSDFLHETVVCIATTKSLVMQAMRDAGFHDADEWVENVKQFPIVRGDRFLILLDVTLPGVGGEGGKTETFSLDELLQYRGWGISAGPYGWMFKGDPERAMTKPAEAPVNPLLQPDTKDDRFKILRDDPQIALIYKGIQHMSQSFADQPLAYDNWLYPMMRYWRNTRLLPQEVFDSNGDVPVKMTMHLVNEEEMLTESARVWHDKPYADFMLTQVPIAREIDAAKQAFWTLPADSRMDVPQGKVLLAQMQKGYAELDAAWADWSQEHAQFNSDEPHDLELIKQEAAQWKKHMDLRREWAEKNCVAALAAKDNALGREMIARSQALQAGNKEAREYWTDVQQSLDVKTDPRADWISHVNAQVALTQAWDDAANAGLAYGKAIDAGADVAPAKEAYDRATAKVHNAQLQLDLVKVNFEISKREGIEDDPDLPQLRRRKASIEEELKAAGARH